MSIREQKLKQRRSVKPWDLHFLEFRIRQRLRIFNVSLILFWSFIAVPAQTANFSFDLRNALFKWPMHHKRKWKNIVPLSVSKYPKTYRNQFSGAHFLQLMSSTAVPVAQKLNVQAQAENLYWLLLYKKFWLKIYQLGKFGLVERVCLWLASYCIISLSAALLAQLPASVNSGSLWVGIQRVKKCLAQKLSATCSARTAFQYTDGSVTGTDGFVFQKGQPDNMYGKQNCAIFLASRTPTIVSGSFFAGTLDDTGCEGRIKNENPRVMRGYICGKKAAKWLSFILTRIKQFHYECCWNSQNF